MNLTNYTKSIIIGLIATSFVSCGLENSSENGEQRTSQEGTQLGSSVSSTESTNSAESNGNSLKKDGDTQITKTTESGAIFKIMANGKEIELDTGAKDIKEIVTFGDFVAYDWIGPVGPVKKIFNTKTLQSITGIPNGKLSSTKDFVYVCDTSANGVPSVRVFDIKNQEYHDFFSKLYLSDNHLQVTECEFDDTNTTISFSTLNGNKETKKYQFKYENNTFRDLN